MFGNGSGGQWTRRVNSEEKNENGNQKEEGGR